MTTDPDRDLTDDDLDAETLAEGAKDLFTADVDEADPILQPDAPPSDSE